MADLNTETQAALGFQEQTSRKGSSAQTVGQLSKHTTSNRLTACGILTQPAIIPNRGSFAVNLRSDAAPADCVVVFRVGDLKALYNTHSDNSHKHMSERLGVALAALVDVVEPTAIIAAPADLARRLDQADNNSFLQIGVAKQHFNTEQVAKKLNSQGSGQFSLDIIPDDLIAQQTERVLTSLLTTPDTTITDTESGTTTSVEQTNTIVTSIVESGPDDLAEGHFRVKQEAPETFSIWFRTEELYSNPVATTVASLHKTFHQEEPDKPERTFSPNFAVVSQAPRFPNHWLVLAVPKYRFDNVNYQMQEGDFHLQAPDDRILKHVANKLELRITDAPASKLRKLHRKGVGEDKSLTEDEWDEIDDLLTCSPQELQEIAADYQGKHSGDQTNSWLVRDILSLVTDEIKVQPSWGQRFNYYILKFQEAGLQSGSFGLSPESGAFSLEQVGGNFVQGAPATLQLVPDRDHPDVQSFFATQDGSLSISWFIEPDDDTVILPDNVPSDITIDAEQLEALAGATTPGPGNPFFKTFTMTKPGMCRIIAMVTWPPGKMQPIPNHPEGAVSSGHVHFVRQSFQVKSQSQALNAAFEHTTMEGIPSAASYAARAQILPMMQARTVPRAQLNQWRDDLQLEHTESDYVIVGDALAEGHSKSNTGPESYNPYTSTVPSPAQPLHNYSLEGGAGGDIKGHWYVYRSDGVSGGLGTVTPQELGLSNSTLPLTRISRQASAQAKFRVEKPGPQLVICIPEETTPNGHTCYGAPAYFATNILDEDSELGEQDERLREYGREFRELYAYRPESWSDSKPWLTPIRAAYHNEQTGEAMALPIYVGETEDGEYVLADLNPKGILSGNSSRMKFGPAPLKELFSVFLANCYYPTGRIRLSHKGVGVEQEISGNSSYGETAATAGAWGLGLAMAGLALSWTPIAPFLFFGAMVAGGISAISSIKDTTSHTVVDQSRLTLDIVSLAASLTGLAALSGTIVSRGLSLGAQAGRGGHVALDATKLAGIRLSTLVKSDLLVSGSEVLLVSYDAYEQISAIREDDSLDPDLKTYYIARALANFLMAGSMYVAGAAGDMQTLKSKRPGKTEADNIGQRPRFKTPMDEEDLTVLKTLIRARLEDEILVAHVFCNLQRWPSIKYDLADKLDAIWASHGFPTDGPKLITARQDFASWWKSFLGIDQTAPGAPDLQWAKDNQFFITNRSKSSHNWGVANDLATGEDWLPLFAPGTVFHGGIDLHSGQVALHPSAGATFADGSAVDWSSSRQGGHSALRKVFEPMDGRAMVGFAIRLQDDGSLQIINYKSYFFNNHFNVKVSADGEIQANAATRDRNMFVDQAVTAEVKQRLESTFDTPVVDKYDPTIYDQIYAHNKEPVRNAEALSIYHDKTRFRALVSLKGDSPQVHLFPIEGSTRIDNSLVDSMRGFKKGPAVEDNADDVVFFLVDRWGLDPDDNYAIFDVRMRGKSLEVVDWREQSASSQSDKERLANAIEKKLDVPCKAPASDSILADETALDALIPLITERLGDQRVSQRVLHHLRRNPELTKELAMKLGEIWRRHGFPSAGPRVLTARQEFLTWWKGFAGYAPESPGAPDLEWAKQHHFFVTNRASTSHDWGLADHISMNEDWFGLFKPGTVFHGGIDLYSGQVALHPSSRSEFVDRTKVAWSSERKGGHWDLDEVFGPTEGRAMVGFAVKLLEGGGLEIINFKSTHYNCRFAVSISPESGKVQVDMSQSGDALETRNPFVDGQVASQVTEQVETTFGRPVTQTVSKEMYSRIHRYNNSPVRNDEALSIYREGTNFRAVIAKDGSGEVTLLPLKFAFRVDGSHAALRHGAKRGVAIEADTDDSFLFAIEEWGLDQSTDYAIFDVEYSENSLKVVDWRTQSQTSPTGKETFTSAIEEQLGVTCRDSDTDPARGITSIAKERLGDSEFANKILSYLRRRPELIKDFDSKMEEIWSKHSYPTEGRELQTARQELVAWWNSIAGAHLNGPIPPDPQWAQDNMFFITNRMGVSADWGMSDDICMTTNWLQVFAPGTVFHGGFDLDTGKIALHPSAGATLANGESITWASGRSGGHAAMKSLFGDPMASNTVGFAVRLTESGNLEIVNYKSFYFNPHASLTVENGQVKRGPKDYHDVLDDIGNMFVNGDITELTRQKMSETIGVSVTDNLSPEMRDRIFRYNREPVENAESLSIYPAGTRFWAICSTKDDKHVILAPVANSRRVDESIVDPRRSMFKVGPAVEPDSTINDILAAHAAYLRHDAYSVFQVQKTGQGLTPLDMTSAVLDNDLDPMHFEEALEAALDVTVH